MRKVYCLDCDNTLWGGAVGEVGPHGVELSEAYLAVQRRFVARQARGALLCLVSRNRAEDVREVLHARAAELALRSEHVVAVRAAWDMHKGEAVLELAATLGLDPVRVDWARIHDPATCRPALDAMLAACCCLRRRAVLLRHTPR